VPAKQKILLGITGGIAAYKIPQLIRDFVKSGADVRVVMTQSASQFVPALTLSTVSGNEVIIGSFPEETDHHLNASTWHIELAQWADILLIAPATANTIAKIAHGYADNAVTTLALAMRCPVILSPSMDTDMWLRTSTQANIATLREFGFIILPPASGELASGLSGPGRLPDLPLIQSAVQKILRSAHRDLDGKNILVTAGPTHEPVDPVRFIGNRSSGKMGFAIATAAARRGANVTLVAGPVTLRTPLGVKRIDVNTAEQMYRAMVRHQKENNIIIMAAAVADFTPVKYSTHKIKKESIQSDRTTIEVKRTKDILHELGKNKGDGLLVGFALETKNEIAYAKKKLKEKNLDFIIVNNPTNDGAGFETDTNIVTIVSRRGKTERLKLMPKYGVANEILNRIVSVIKK
jgi:phosphopantothenoylcysteine decarboxylase / phosphopantothenate---cysteine ligase